MLYELKNFDDLKNSTMRASSELSEISENLKEEKEEITKNLNDIQKHFNKVVFFAEHEDYDRAVAHCKLLYQLSKNASAQTRRLVERVCEVEYDPYFKGKSSMKHAESLFEELAYTIYYAEQLLDELQLAA